MTPLETILNYLKNFIIKYAGAFLYSAIFLAISVLILFILKKIITKALHRANASEKLVKVVINTLRTVIYTIVVLVILNAFEVPVTAIAAIISAVGLAFSLAVKDSLANFAEGLLLMITRPFKVGDSIETQGVSGTVQSIEIVYTRLLTPDNKTILIPNSEVAGAKIINLSSQPTRRLELIFLIGHQQDVSKAKQIILETVLANPLSHKDPNPVVCILSYKQNGIELGVRVWTNTGDDYSHLETDLKEDIQQALNCNHFSSPNPHFEISLTEKAKG